MEIECDNCNRTFKLDPKQIHIKPFGKEYEEEYLVCPYCEKEYTIIYTNSKIRELRKEWYAEGNPQYSKAHNELRKELQKLNEYIQLAKRLGMRL